jgi:pimeloyl-ACP methyl ester carboxylesterase
MTQVEKVTSRDGTSIAFERAGAGPAVILIDPACSFRGLSRVAPLGAELTNDFTVFTYDRRGRGDSTDTLPYAVDREVDDLEALIEAAGGSAYVYGFSSGAVLALHAAARNLAIPKLALLEPPVILHEEPAGPDLGAELTELVAQGRRGDAIEHFHTSIGVPDELITGMRDAPYWPGLEALAHTLVYDTTITSTLEAAHLATTTPTMVIYSEQSDLRLRTWAREVAEALPNATHRAFGGEWHGVAPEVLAPAVTEFFTTQL